MKALTLTKFKKRFALTQKEVKHLHNEKIVEIQQNGYRGHILMHHKIVAYDETVLFPRLELLKNLGRKIQGGSLLGLPVKNKRLKKSRSDMKMERDRHLIIETVNRWNEGTTIPFYEMGIDRLNLIDMSLAELAYIWNHPEKFDLRKDIPLWVTRMDVPRLAR